MISIAKALQLRAMIVKAAAALSDTDALSAVELFAPWKVDEDYVKGDRRRDDGRLFKCEQNHHSQADWRPRTTPALWTEVAEPGTGTKDNPIPYSGNMALENGKYYIQDGVEYLCIRDTINPVYNALADLVGLYVEIVE